MKAVTIGQPWAMFLALGMKRYEPRAKPTAWRGPVAIHARIDMPFILRGQAFWERWGAVLLPLGIRCKDDMPVGVVIAVADLVACHPVTRGRPRDDEDPRTGAFALEFARPRLITYVPAKGSHHVWEWEGAA